MKNAGLAALAAVLLLTASACGGNDSAQVTEAQKPVITSMAASLSGASTGLFDATQAQCVATAFVTDVGVDRLKAVQAVGETGTYIPNGALVDTTNADAYAKAVVGCVPEADFEKKLAAVAAVGYTKGSALKLPSGQVSCLMGKFVDSAGIAAIFEHQFVSDTGEFTTPDTAYDKGIASSFVDALLACVDYPALDAKLAVQADKKLDAAKLTSCLKRKTTTAVLKALLVSRLTVSPEFETLSAGHQSTITACEKVSKKKA